MEEMKGYLIKMVCCSDPDDGPWKFLWYLPDTPVGDTCPNCHKVVEPNDGIHSWIRIDLESLDRQVPDVFMVYITAEIEEDS